MSLTENSIRFGTGPVPLDMSIRKDVPFWESIEAHYSSIRDKAIEDARKEARQEAKDSFERKFPEVPRTPSRGIQFFLSKNWGKIQEYHQRRGRPLGKEESE